MVENKMVYYKCIKTNGNRYRNIEFVYRVQFVVPLMIFQLADKKYWIEQFILALVVIRKCFDAN
jgi:hypothetical protein